jgi:glycosyltransferase involved in cell wall biosynthesis
LNGPRVLALTGDESGPTLWRVFQPYTELQRRGYGAWFRHKDDPEMDAPEWPYLAATRLEAIVIPRFYWRDHVSSRQWIRTLHKAGLAVIYDLDDDVLTPQIGARQHATTEKDKPLEELEQDRRDRIAALRLCDGVTTSNHELASVIRQYTDAPVVVVPNAIDVAWFRRTLAGARRIEKQLTIGWAGGARYQEDLEPVAEAWHNVAQKRADVHFIVQGFLPDVLTDAVPPRRLHRLPWLPLAEYPRALKNVDIACCSVADNHFNRCKTPIKAWEFTLAGAVSVCSPTLYGPGITPEQDALVAETAADWESALLRLVDDADLRRRLWRAQRRRVATEHALSKQVLEWPRAWQSILDDFRSHTQRLSA